MQVIVTDVERVVRALTQFALLFIRINCDVVN